MSLLFSVQIISDDVELLALHLKADGPGFGVENRVVIRNCPLDRVRSGLLEGLE